MSFTLTTNRSCTGAHNSCWLSDGGEDWNNENGDWDNNRVDCCTTSFGNGMALGKHNLLILKTIKVYIKLLNIQSAYLGKPLFEMCCFHMGIARKGGCKGLPGWFGALFSHVARGCKGLPGWFGAVFHHLPV